MHFIIYLFAISIGLASAQFNFLNSGSCRNRNRQSTLLSAKDSVCCDGLIKTLAESALSTAGFIPGQSQFVDIAGKAAKIVQNFIQNHFGKAFEIVIAKKQFAMKTNYKGSKICKFEANGWYLSIYETPGKYDIKNSTLEAYFDGFSSKDPLGVKRVSQAFGPRAAFGRFSSSPLIHRGINRFLGK